MHQCFIGEDDLHGGSLHLTDTQRHHFDHVLRLRPGEPFFAVVSGKRRYTLSFQDRIREVSRVSLHDERDISIHRSPQLILVQCLPKQDKLSEILRACTELGIDTFIPVTSMRTDTINTSALAKKQHRWERILHSAACQAKRDNLPHLMPVHPLLEVPSLPAVRSADWKLLPWEEEGRVSLKSHLDGSPDRPNRVVLVIGPEGGLDAREVAILRKAGFIPVSLGNTILRVEHAGMAVAAQIQYVLTSES